MQISMEATPTLTRDRKTLFAPVLEAHTTYAVIYFLLTISLGAFFAMNLFIVVIVRHAGFPA